MKSKMLHTYETERRLLSDEEIYSLLDEGRKWDLSECLKNGGVGIFPHTYLKHCGDHIAACVHACLDSGADQILIIGVLHGLSEKLLQARKDELDGMDLQKEPLRCIQGPDLMTGREWETEFSLKSFLFLLEHELRRRNQKSPKIYCRFPFLVNKSPQSLPEIAELEKIAKSSVILATADLCHHGLAYGDALSDVITGDSALQYAKKSVTRSLSFLEGKDYEGFIRHSVEIKSDALDVGSILMHLRGPLTSTVHDLRIVDTAALFDHNVQPSWVAAGLISCS